MPYNVFTVVNKFLDLGQRDSIDITPLKLQKLLYFTQGWHLGIKGTPFFNGDFYAWKFGPVFPPVYNRYVEYGGSPIDYTDRNFATEKICDGDEQYIESMWKTLKDFTPIQLSNISHVKGGPWDKCKGYYQIIPNDLIKDYFSKELKVLRDNKNGQ